MQKDKHKTDVIFRVDNSKDFKGTVFALMPHDCYNSTGNVNSYQHVGQHSGASYLHCMKTSRPAKPNEYKDLKQEMEGLGYNFNLVKRQTYKKFLVSYHETRK